MSKTKKSFGLGKGVSTLFADYQQDNEPTKIEENNGNVSRETVLFVKLDSIKPNENQPRKVFEETALNELADSIRHQGVLQPILVEEYAPGKYSIVAGERRFRAAQIAELKEIPVIVRKFSAVQKSEVALIENIQRENLNAIEEARAYKDIIEKSGMSQNELADMVGKNRTTITNSLRLLQLPDTIQDDLVSGVLTAGHARAILSLVNPSDRIILRNRIVEKDLSVRDAERVAESFNEGKKLIVKKNVVKANDAIKQEVEDKFLEAFGTKVQVTGNLRRGKVVIPYKSKNDLERLYSLLSKGELFED
ncbi:MAG: ParB/RepB/Spo0J family partition protein [Sphaerochaetaceae bacterium]|nr:ParB/RepB/Spo0J family partition protein [Sphaerochaetaceae bacterium]